MASRKKIEKPVSDDKTKVIKKKKQKVPGSGRKKGTPNRTTAETRKAIEDFAGWFYVDKINTEEFREKFNKLGITTQMVLAEKIVQYAIPKKREDKFTVDDEALEKFKQIADNAEKINSMFENNQKKK